jgi:hypothetical protein
MNLSARREAFRDLHERGSFVMPNPWDVPAQFAAPRWIGNHERDVGRATRSSGCLSTWPSSEPTAP